MNILNIPVSDAQLAQWRSWLAPAQQPFFLTDEQAQALNLPTVPRAEANLTDVERDTFTTWAISKQVERVAWLTLEECTALPKRTQKDLLRLQVAHGRGNVPLGKHYADLLPGLKAGRFLWQAEQLTPAVLKRLLERGDGQPCQREQVPEHIWTQAKTLLPGVRELAGTFSSGIGNCFGTVMGAAGEPGAAEEWMQRDPFANFLTRHATRGGRDDQPGTLLVWRNADGEAEHAAVTLGGGWAFHKPSQTWWTPRSVQPVRDLIRNWRTPGQRLTRYTLKG